MTELVANQVLTMVATTPPVFVLGVYVQDTAHMQLWKDRGINTMVEAPDGADITGWSAAAHSLDLYQIRQPIVAPSPNKPLTKTQISALQKDAATPGLIAWAQPDEPSNTNNGFATVSYTPAQLEAMAKQLRSAAPNMPLWENHVGNHITPDWALDVRPRWHKQSGLMQDYMQGPEADWLASDTYQIQSGDTLIKAAGGWNSSTPSYVSTPQGIAADRQIAWSTDATWTGGKPVMSFIATSAYGGTGQQVPSPEQFNVQAWSSVIHGATGIVYFPVQLSPWQWDATPSFLVDALTSFDHEIAGARDPAGVQALTGINNILVGTSNVHTVYRSALDGAAPGDHQLPYGFEATSIQTASGTYKIILNMTGETKTLTSAELGLKDAVFAPYEVMRGYAFVTGTLSADTLAAANAPTTMKGYAGDDTLTGGSSDDSLYGGAGNDFLSGGGGKNAFVFAAAPGSAGVDTISDFKHGTDLIKIDHLAFTGFNAQNAMGFLPTSMFAEVDHEIVATRIVYDRSTGDVYYDPDGSGQAAMLKIATVNEPGGTHTLTASDLFVF
jgi:hypothetical protein